MDATSGTEDKGGRPASGRPQGRAFGSAVFPMRLLGVGTCILIGGLHIVHFETFRGWHLVLLAYALAYPYVYRYLSLRIESRKRLEYATVLMDGFLLGATVYVTGFSDVVMLSLLTVALANGMALGGARLMAASVVSSGLGMGLPAMAYGIQAAPGELVVTNILASVFLLFYFIMFASVANRRARLLRESRHEVRRQKADIEIEKRKSDGLLWALLPGPMVEAVHQGRTPAPERYEHTTLLVARACDLSETMTEHGPDAAVAELNHCFKAFDEIIQRHGLEPFKVIGECYVALAGAPTPSETHAEDAEAAAREMRQFVEHHAESRRHAGKVSLAFGFAVHSDAAVGGLIQARRFGFELWGDALQDALATARRAAPGQILGGEDGA